MQSTLIDLILTGLFGIRPQPNRTLVVNPLLSTGGAGAAAAGGGGGGGGAPFKSFVVEHLHYKGRNVGVKWAAGSGLQIFLDGKLAAHRATMGLLRVDV